MRGNVVSGSLCYRSKQEGPAQHPFSQLHSPAKRLVVGLTRLIDPYLLGHLKEKPKIPKILLWASFKPNTSMFP